ncbi:hypothetical protein WJX74_006172 [Apatococcus lobatus]|uniref:Intradiol ring-cleavage dioxygenases domain-containing protein n=2 Tax=Apatococcus TaxID=904362 RepID=A0AAW1SPH2_9CHLO
MKPQGNPAPARDQSRLQSAGPSEGPFMFSAGQPPRGQNGASGAAQTGFSVDQNRPAHAKPGGPTWIHSDRYMSSGISTTENEQLDMSSLTRRWCYSREFLKAALAGGVVIVFLITILSTSISRHAALSSSQGKAGYSSSNCTLTPERAEGPYYLQEELFREDIIEGQAGVPLLLRIQVVDEDCEPLPNAYVDVWHCNSTGYYSGYTGLTAPGGPPGGSGGPGKGGPSKGSGGVGHLTNTDGLTFLRGTLLTDQAGVVGFMTIVPGWYGGRTPHIHMKVHIPNDDDADYESEAREYADSHVSHTGQLFFPEDMYMQIESLDPYTKDQNIRLRLTDDDIYNNDPTAILGIMQLDVAAIKYGVVGTATVTVNPDSTPAVVLRR